MSGLLFSPTTPSRVLPNLQRRAGRGPFILLILLAFFCAEVSAQVELEGRQIQDVSTVFDELGKSR